MGANLFAQLKTDKSKVEDGVWFDNVIKGAGFKVARTTSKKFREYMKQISKPYRHILRRGAENLDDDTAIELWSEAASKYLLLDWKNVVDDDGKDIKYTPEVGKQYLSALEDLREIIGDLAGDLDAFREEYVEESAEALKKQ